MQKNISDTTERTFHARSYSSGTPGRAICNSRNHYFIADDVGYDEVTAGEYFLTGLTACAVNMLTRVAKEMNLPIKHLDVQADGTYLRGHHNDNDVTLFERVSMTFELTGVSHSEASKLVATYQKRCPLYGTVVTATSDVKIKMLVK